MTVVVVPTCRAVQIKNFSETWRSSLAFCELVIVQDGLHPRVLHRNKMYPLNRVAQNSRERSLIFNQNDGIRNLGFLYAARFLPDTDAIVTLDDDVVPLGDTIDNHLFVLNTFQPISWISTASRYMRGFPYDIRTEARVWASHGVWDNVLDYDAPTQLVTGNQIACFYKGPIPRGAYAPICGMNFAFTREAMPHVYFAPMGPRAGMDRFADIWMGIHLKRESDKQNRAIVTGYSTVHHTRLSNVFENLRKEALGLQLNEQVWKSDPKTPYFRMYSDNRKRWRDLMAKLLKL